MIKKCDCKNAWQDKRYGKGMRVQNATSSTPPKYRCTVCGKENS